MQDHHEHTMQLGAQPAASASSQPCPATPISSEKADHARDIRIRQLSRVPIIETQLFLDKVLPAVFGGERENVLCNVMANLEGDVDGRGPALQKKGNTHVWSSFSEEPKASGKTEVKTFESLVSVAGDICKAVEACAWANGPPVQHFTYQNNGNRSPTSLNRDEDNKSRPDGYFVRSHTSGVEEGVEWADIGAIGEFKKGDTGNDVQDDARKILWGMNTIMRSDPRRRSAYGFTIENTTTRLWFCDRTQIVTSTPFDFCKDPRSLVIFFLTAMYADETALGWDPTIVRVPDSERQSQFPVQYDITVHHRHEDGGIEEVVYRTEELISERGADGIYGSGTRVWTARRKTAAGKVDLNSPPVILKDTWIDVNRHREGWVVNTLRHECRVAFADPDAIAAVEDHLLTVLAHGDVYLNIDQRQPDVTRILSCYLLKRDGDQLHFFNINSGIFPSHGPTDSTSNSHLSPLSCVDHLPRQYVELGPKAHYRIVCKERGESIHDVKSLSQVFSAIYDIGKLLFVIHTLGWVHRDISSGNILLCGKRGVLADFEYAKRWNDDQSPPETRTGTQYFRALEADRLEYLFRSSTPEHRVRKVSSSTKVDEKSSSIFAFLDATPKQIVSLPPSKRKAELAYRYHPLNEWESLFWLSMYFILCRVVDQGTSSRTHPRRKLEDQWWLAHALFYGFSTRLHLFTRGSVSYTHHTFLGHLEGTLHPEVTPIAPYLLMMRRKLLAAYNVAERDEDKHPDGEVSLRLVQDVLLILREIHNMLEKKDVKIKPLPASYEDN